LQERNQIAPFAGKKIIPHEGMRRGLLSSIEESGEGNAEEIQREFRS